ncbi:MAG: response regulator [Actinomycetota bacterium]|nr:response regulator [Actinomycetota bacterium]
MIRTLVVDDDYRVAHIHAASVERIDGFTCVGEAHSAAEARLAIADLKPDLLLLDVYLPDEDGLSLLRSLNVAGGSTVDCILVTAARDVDTVRTAFRAGALRYLVKPFGFAQLREQLDSYRRWRQRIDSSGEADQATIDSLYGLLRAPSTLGSTRHQLAPTPRKILDAVRDATCAIGAAEVAEQVGISRPTAQRYLADLERTGIVELVLSYGATGRPVNRYQLKRSTP